MVLVVQVFIPLVDYFWGGTEGSAPTNSNCHLFIRRGSVNVGIGTTDAGYKLQVGGNTRCSGSATCTGHYNYDLVIYHTAQSAGLGTTA